MYDYASPFRGLTKESVMLLLSYPDLLEDDAILSIGLYEFSNKHFNDPIYNRQLASNFCKAFIFFDAYNGIPFKNNNKQIFFKIVNGTMEHLIVRSLDGAVLLSRHLKTVPAPLISDEEYELTLMEHRFIASRDDAIIRIIDKDANIVLQRSVNDGTTLYTTNAVTEKEALHYCKIVTVMYSDDFPFEHEEPTEILRVDTEYTPKGYAGDIVYEHFLQSELPLRTPSLQNLGAHKMWIRLVNRAINDKYNAYFWNGCGLIKINEENKSVYFDAAFGLDDSFAKCHLVISKNELN